MTDIENFWAVIPAGGAGTRLWPLSRKGAPKFLHDLTRSGRSLLQETWDRVQPLAADRVLVVTGAAHRPAVAEQLPGLPDDQLLAEPSPRDSMAAIGLAAAILEVRDPDAVLGSFAADQVIEDQAGFLACVREAAEVAAARDVVVTLGIEPTHPATGFGYIRSGELLDPAGSGTARTVEQFVEKPDAATAAEYLASGRYRWNGGMFVVRASFLLDQLAISHPDLAAGLRAIAAEPTRLDELWGDLEKIAIDHAVAEPAADRGLVATVPGTFDWDDVGDFDALAGLLGKGAKDGEGHDVTVLGDAARVRTLDASGIVVAGTDREVAVIGLDDVVVVDTGDALLVTTRSRAQDVKKIVEALKADGVDGVL
ncbi:mannose-1-phosphate guanylyltransferase [Nocardioides zeae]|uniref:Mannose-1-phosphate guanylyltransferase n=1 Tax=Nocardioides imazamoxiresistens TaxID=3231893 RepID=A0ABU3PWG8_9ACTN|nr:mannose-1-phosphate guanylyltransferase [Nocardioides zeae]MDT9593574.1 mannose-1-phosphate guanylyltransferase [Nocardioides zeae]